MKLASTWLLPGVYQYTYPSFVAPPQLICIHFLTPDGQQAIVSYPRHPRCKAAQLISRRWFESVELRALGGTPPLMGFIEFLVSGLVSSSGLITVLPDERAEDEVGESLAA